MALRRAPVVSEEKVIFGSNDGYVYAVDSALGCCKIQTKMDKMLVHVY